MQDRIAISLCLITVVCAACLSRNAPRSDAALKDAETAGQGAATSASPTPAPAADHASTTPASPTPEPTPSEPGRRRTYEDIRSILDERCVPCHGPGQDPVFTRFPFDSLMSSNQRDLMRVVLRLVRSTGKDRMPPLSRPSLTAEQITDLADWLSSGLPAD